MGRLTRGGGRWAEWWAEGLSSRCGIGISQCKIDHCIM